jgi:hypothetical protein
MAVAFMPGNLLGRSDLDIFLQDSQGIPANAASITYAIFYVDPGPPEAEVLIGPAQRVPVNPAVGEYYGSVMIPMTATPGTYRIRWTFKETVSSPDQNVVQEFAVVILGSAVSATKYSKEKQQMINSLRVLLRDQCVGGEEQVEVDTGGKIVLVSMEELWETLHDLMV